MTDSTKARTLILEDLVITLDEEPSAKQARVSLIAFASNLWSNEAKEQSVKTQAYGIINGRIIRWQEKLQVPYHEQQQISFETACEFEYGFKKEQMKWRFEGIIYLKEQFYVSSGTTQVFLMSGEKVGSLSYLVKMTSINPAFGKARPKQQTIEEEEQPDFRGRVIIYSAVAKIRQQHYFIKSKKMVLRLRLGIKNHKTKVAEDARWSETVKFDRHDEDELHCELLDAEEGEALVAKGMLELDQLKKNKRFTIQSITLSDVNQKHVGQLVVDMRFVQKQQALQMKERRKAIKPRDNISSVELKPSSPRPMEPRSQSILTKKDKVELNKSMVSGTDLRTEMRYKRVHILNDNHEIIIPKAKRFGESPRTNPNISYVDLEEISQFRPGRKGASIGLGQKYDFTASRKGNPGVGQYRLPSIWDKY